MYCTDDDTDKKRCSISRIPSTAPSPLLGDMSFPTIPLYPGPSLVFLVFDLFPFLFSLSHTRTFANPNLSPSFLIIFLLFVLKMFKGRDHPLSLSPSSFLSFSFYPPPLLPIRSIILSLPRQPLLLLITI